MHLINADWTFRPISRAACFHPLSVAPFVALEVVNERAGRYAVLIEKGEWIALKQERADLGANFEFVMRAFFDAGQK